MRVLVTGASGFIGRHVVAALHARGDEVLAVARREPLRPAGVAWAPAPAADDDARWRVLLDGKVAVVNLAGLAHQVGVPDAACDYHTPNHLLAATLARVAREAGVARLVHLSTMSVYGEVEAVGPATPLDPQGAYGASKLAGERAIDQALTGSTTVAVILRAPLVHGSGNPGNLQRLERLIARGLPLPLGGVRAERSYLHVGNLADFIHLAAHDARVGAGIYLLADGPPVALPEVLRGIAARMGVGLRLFACPDWLLDAAATGLDLTRGGGRRYRSSLAKLRGRFVVDTRDTELRTGWTAPLPFATAIRTPGPAGDLGGRAGQGGT